MIYGDLKRLTAEFSAGSFHIFCVFLLDVCHNLPGAGFLLNKLTFRPNILTLPLECLTRLSVNDCVSLLFIICRFLVLCYCAGMFQHIQLV